MEVEGGTLKMTVFVELGHHPPHHPIQHPIPLLLPPFQPLKYTLILFSTYFPTISASTFTFLPRLSHRHHNPVLRVANQHHLPPPLPIVHLCNSRASAVKRIVAFHYHIPQHPSPPSAGGGKSALRRRASQTGSSQLYQHDPGRSGHPYACCR